jgi:DNA-binding LytR/AlgR family response regulator
VPATAPPPPTYFDILDGGRTLRTPLGKIISLRAAGNYVEFLLEDGTKPLMRTSLTDMEAALAPAGFVRTHRSWLINQHHIRTLTPTGSGDFTLTLDGGTEAPLSRRFPAALARLRAAR